MRVRFEYFVRFFGFLSVITAFTMLWKLKDVSYFSESNKSFDHSHGSDFNEKRFKNTNNSHDFDLFGSKSLHSIQCIVNGRLTHGCYLLKPQEILIPFELVRTYFKVYGTLDLSSSTFYLDHANVDVPKPYLHRHNPVGVYMQFHKSNVEKRDNVKLIVADEGVPISQQWDPRGYPYPIQIAQFGLSHFSQLVLLADQAKFENVQNVLSLDDTTMELDLIVPSNNVIHNWTDSKHIYEWNNKLTLSANKLNSNGQALSITPKLQQWDYLIMIGRQWTYGSSVELSVLWYPPVTVGSYNNYPAKSLIVYNCSKSPSAYQTYSTIHKNRVTYWMPKCEKQAKTYGFADSIMLARDIHSDLVKAFHPHRRLSEYAGWTGMKLMNTVNDTQNSSIKHQSDRHSSVMTAQTEQSEFDFQSSEHKSQSYPIDNGVSSRVLSLVPT
ncbi:unnamed protein product [Schistosoma turkestanicum]|nr:unnamed protein product [Schistosoma turkestanicum]